MKTVLQVGKQRIQEHELYDLLAQYQYLPRLARELIIDQAIADIQCTPEEKVAVKEQFFQQLQITSQEQLNTWLIQSGMTIEQFEPYILRDLKLEKFKQAEWDHLLESHFLECKNQLDKIVYSLIRTKEPGIAQELYFRIQENESDFADLARRYSEGGEAETGGLIGPVELNVPHPQIVQILTTGMAGKISPPTQIGEWWIILRLEKYISTQLDDNIRQRLRNDLFQKWLMNQLQNNVTYSPSEELQSTQDTVKSENPEYSLKSLSKIEK
ncbi:MAG: peptidylprolyl isomerase [Snowella sp.]|nr:peptidylprolyl isomerase [Snowella sp.]